MDRDQEIRILAATLERLEGRDEMIGMLSRLSPKERYSLRVAIHAEFGDRRSERKTIHQAGVVSAYTPELNPWMQPKALRRGGSR